MFKAFATELIEDGNENKPSYLQHPPKLFSEAAWVQLCFLLKFWTDDTSPDFEKTDQAIEKSVQTAFDVFENTPLSALVDFGKFLWKEKIRGLLKTLDYIPTNKIARAGNLVSTGIKLGEII